MSRRLASVCINLKALWLAHARNSFPPSLPAEALLKVASLTTLRIHAYGWRMAVNGVIWRSPSLMWSRCGCSTRDWYTAHNSSIDARMCSFESKKTVHLRGKRMCGESLGSFENSRGETLRVAGERMLDR